jgi:hypothetical protein
MASPFLTLPLIRSERSVSRPCRWVGPKARLDSAEMIEISYSYSESNPDSTAVQSVARLYTE